jgi:membrane protein insertase Oxa1/YidC/SpoIIIJ
MEFNDYCKPILTEPGVKYFLSNTLKNCHEIKNKFHTLVFNVGLFIIFLLILISILYFKYKGKLTLAEKYQKDKEKQEYILSKIQKFELDKKKARQELITGLPNWENEFSAINTKLVY